MIKRIKSTTVSNKKQKHYRKLKHLQCRKLLKRMIKNLKIQSNKEIKHKISIKSYHLEIQFLLMSKTLLKVVLSETKMGVLKQNRMKNKMQSISQLTVIQTKKNLFKIKKRRNNRKKINSTLHNQNVMNKKIKINKLMKANKIKIKTITKKTNNKNSRLIVNKLRMKHLIKQRGSNKKKKL